MSKERKQAICDAEQKVADILEDLERDYEVRAHHITIVSNRREVPLVTIVPDMGGGSL